MSKAPLLAGDLLLFQAVMIGRFRWISSMREEMYKATNYRAPKSLPSSGRKPGSCAPPTLSLPSSNGLTKRISRPVYIAMSRPYSYWSCSHLYSEATPPGCDGSAVADLGAYCLRGGACESAVSEVMPVSGLELGEDPWSAGWVGGQVRG